MRPATPSKSVEKIPDVSLYLLSAARAAKSHRTPSPSTPKKRRSINWKTSKQQSPHTHHSGRISQDSLSEGVHYRAGGLGESLEDLRMEIQQRKLSQEDRDIEIQRIMACSPQEETAPTEEAKGHGAATAVTVEEEEEQIRGSECCEACLIV